MPSSGQVEASCGYQHKMKTYSFSAVGAAAYTVDVQAYTAGPAAYTDGAVAYTTSAATYMRILRIKFNHSS